VDISSGSYPKLFNSLYLKNILTNYHFSLDFLEELAIAVTDDEGFINYYCSNWWPLDEARENVEDPESKPCKSSTVSMSGA
jgi:hypothetical protein